MYFMRFVSWRGMGLFTALLIIAVFGQPAGRASVTDRTPPASPSDRVVLEGHRGEHSFVVTLAKRHFAAGKHQIRIEEGGFTFVDGQRAYGPLGHPPREELSLFRVSVDGEKWTVPGRQWRDCYEPNLGKSGGPPPVATYTQARLSKDGHLLVVEMLGSDGGGAYRVRWYLHRDGTHRRAIEELG